MSVQKKEKAMWEMLDRFFLRVLGEKGNGGHGGKPGTSRIVFSQLSGDLPLPACPYAKHDPAAGRSLHCIEAPGAGC